MHRLRGFRVQGFGFRVVGLKGLGLQAPRIGSGFSGVWVWGWLPADWIELRVQNKGAGFRGAPGACIISCLVGMRLVFEWGGGSSG